MSELFSAKNLSAPHEELAYLRKRVAELETPRAILKPEDKPKIAGEVLDEYKKSPAETLLHSKYALAEEKKDALILKLSPEAHDKNMEELLGIFMEHGIKNTFSVLEKMKNQHLDDDFHRLLVQYLITVPETAGVAKNQELWRALNFSLYQVLVPEAVGNPRSFKELASLMEQFYAGMLAVSGDPKNSEKNYFSLEIGLSVASDELIFYVAVPKHRADLFEKHILSIFPTAKLKASPDDYNVFNDHGESVGAYAVSQKNFVLPIKTYDHFETDPLAVLIGAFTKLKREGEGLALQIMLRPAGDVFLKRVGKVLEALKRGLSLKKASEYGTWRGMIDEVFDEFLSNRQEKERREEMLKKIDENSLKAVTEKLGSVIVEAELRLVASAENKDRAMSILHDMTAAFHQFADPVTSGGLIFREVSGREALSFFHNFSYRLFSAKESFPLSLREVASIYYFPEKNRTQGQLKAAEAAQAPAPADLPQKGVLLGLNRYRHLETKVYLEADDRMRHLYVIGQTGTGKTTLLKNMIVQDIENGDGVCMIDPHGTDIVDVLKNIPKNRLEDVIYFDPAHVERPMGLNMLEYDERYPEQKTFVVNELLSIFNKLFDMKVAGGPNFEQYFRNAALTVMEHPPSGNTLLEIGRVMSDRTFRMKKLSYCKNPLILQFWQNAEKTTGESGLSNFVPYITSKFDVFLSNDIMRPIVVQEKSAFNFRDVLDSKKILLVNLSKGRLGDINANLLGLVIVGKLTMAALSRADIAGKELMSDFYLYIDEFQNVTTPSITTIFSEARKYRLSLTVAHQYISQLTEEIKSAVFGNVGSMISFRVGQEDAEFLAKQFSPTFTAQDISKLENRNAYAKLLARGLPQTPFNMATLAPRAGEQKIFEAAVNLSHERYGRPRSEVEQEIITKYRREKTLPPESSFSE